MEAIVWMSFNAAALTGNKAAHAKALSDLIAKQPTILNLVMMSPAVVPAVVTLAAHATTTTVPTVTPIPVPTLL